MQQNTSAHRRRCVPGPRLGAALAVFVASLTAVAGSVAWLTETGGGNPIRTALPSPTVERFDPKVTSVFTDRDSFLQAVLCRTVSVESFENLNPTNQTNRSEITTPDFTMTTDNPPRLGIWDQRFQGAFATDGIQWVGVEENALVVPQVTTFHFDRPITHFGLYTTDFGDFGTDDLEFANDTGDVAIAARSGQPSGSRQFFGIITSDRSFRTVTLTHSNQGEFYGLDEVTYCWRGRPDTPFARGGSTRVPPG